VLGRDPELAAGLAVSLQLPSDRGAQPSGHLVRLQAERGGHMVERAP
jgi:hypothetical protein